MQRVHVYPVGDIKEHITDDSAPCWCHPEEELDQDGPEDVLLIVHNAADQRERYEQSIH